MILYGCSNSVHCRRVPFGRRRASNCGQIADCRSRSWASSMECRDFAETPASKGRRGRSSRPPPVPQTCKVTLRDNNDTYTQNYIYIYISTPQNSNGIIETSWTSFTNEPEQPQSRHRIPQTPGEANSLNFNVEKSFSVLRLIDRFQRSSG